MKNYEKCKAYKIKEPASGVCEGENRKKCLNCPACIRYRETLERKIEELDERLGIVLEGQPEIIRCKDCRYWHDLKRLDCPEFGTCGLANGPVHEKTWFCADGERRGKDDG